MPALGCEEHGTPYSVSARLAAKACDDFFSRVKYPVQIYFALTAENGPTFAKAFMTHFIPPQQPSEITLDVKGFDLGGGPVTQRAF